MTKNNDLLITLGLVSMMLLAGTAGAEDKINPWQDCGIGASVFPKNNIGAAISNVIWDLGTTALTSAASSPDTCKSERANAARFIQQTYDQLANETAIGEGRYLTAVVGLMGCSTSRQAKLVERLRVQMASYITEDSFADRTRAEKAERYFYTLEGIIQADVSGQCLS